MIVASVLRSGGDYLPEHVAALRDGVARWLPSARFVCLSDCDVPCDRIPLITSWPGWLAKIELFRPSLFDDTVLYIDLDTLIVGPLDGIVDYPHRFTMLADFYRPEIPASGVMAWQGDYSHIFTRFADDLVPSYRRYRPFYGDGGWIAGNVRSIDAMQDIAPGLVVSYKLHVAESGIPHDASIVCFHGRPRPWQVDGSTLARASREATEPNGSAPVRMSWSAT